ncbi:MAG TPA: redoxin domain-containing protein [Terriglobia bacterium]|nr:redoxin domain-containing protein [Terriglobia bacterium]
MPQPLVGQIVPEFTLLSTAGTWVRVSDYRGKRNLILIFCGAGNSASVRWVVRLVSELYAEFAAEEAEVFALVHGAGDEAEDLERSCNPLFPVLPDKERRAHELFGVRSSERHCFPAVCVIDRFGELRDVSRPAESQRSSFARDILEWVRYINLECPE